MEPGFEDEGPLVAVRALEWIGAGDGFEKFRPRLRLLRSRIWGDEQKKPGPCDAGLSVAVGQDTIMADFDEAAG